MVHSNSPYQERGVPLSSHMSAHRKGFRYGRSFWLPTDMEVMLQSTLISNNLFCRRSTISNFEEVCSSLWKTLKQLSLTLMQSVKETQRWHNNMLVSIRIRTRGDYL